MADKAGWEVEGFIDQLTRRDDSNSERLVLKAISHLRAFSRDCDALRESSREAADEIERLRAALTSLLQYGDDHDWGFMPTGMTIENARAALNIHHHSETK